MNKSVIKKALTASVGMIIGLGLGTKLGAYRANRQNQELHLTDHITIELSREIDRPESSSWFNVEASIGGKRMSLPSINSIFSRSGLDNEIENEIPAQLNSRIAEEKFKDLISGYTFGFHSDNSPSGIIDYEVKLEYRLWGDGYGRGYAASLVLKPNNQENERRAK